MKTHRRMASAIRLHACNLLGSIKVPMGTIPMGVAFFYGIRGNLKCSAEVNSASAKVCLRRNLVRRKRAALPYGPRLFREHKASIHLEPQDSRGFLFPAYAALPFPYRRGELSVLRPDRAERVSATPSGNFTIV